MDSNQYYNRINHNDRNPIYVYIANDVGEETQKEIERSLNTVFKVLNSADSRYRYEIVDIKKCASATLLNQSVIIFSSKFQSDPNWIKDQLISNVNDKSSSDIERVLSFWGADLLSKYQDIKSKNGKIDFTNVNIIEASYNQNGLMSNILTAFGVDKIVDGYSLTNTSYINYSVNNLTPNDYAGILALYAPKFETQEQTKEYAKWVNQKINDYSKFYYSETSTHLKNDLIQEKSNLNTNSATDTTFIFENSDPFFNNEIQSFTSSIYLNKLNDPRCIEHKYSVEIKDNNYTFTLFGVDGSQIYTSSGKVITSNNVTILKNLYLKTPEGELLGETKGFINDIYLIKYEEILEQDLSRPLIWTNLSSQTITNFTLQNDTEDYVKKTTQNIENYEHKKYLSEFSSYNLDTDPNSFLNTHDITYMKGTYGSEFEIYINKDENGNYTYSYSQEGKTVTGDVVKYPDGSLMLKDVEDELDFHVYKYKYYPELKVKFNYYNVKINDFVLDNDPNLLNQYRIENHENQIESYYDSSLEYNSEDELSKSFAENNIKSVNGKLYVSELYDSFDYTITFDGDNFVFSLIDNDGNVIGSSSGEVFTSDYSYLVNISFEAKDKSGITQKIYRPIVFTKAYNIAYAESASDSTNNIIPTLESSVGKVYSLELENDSDFNSKIKERETNLITNSFLKDNNLTKPTEDDDFYSEEVTKLSFKINSLTDILFKTNVKIHGNNYTLDILKDGKVLTTLNGKVETKDGVQTLKDVNIPLDKLKYSGDISIHKVYESDKSKKLAIIFCDRQNLNTITNMYSSNKSYTDKFEHKIQEIVYEIDSKYVDTNINLSKSAHGLSVIQDSFEALDKNGKTKTLFYTIKFDRSLDSYTFKVFEASDLNNPISTHSGKVHNISGYLALKDVQFESADYTPLSGKSFTRDLLLFSYNIDDELSLIDLSDKSLTAKNVKFFNYHLYVDTFPYLQFLRSSIDNSSDGITDKVSESFKDTKIKTVSSKLFDGKVNYNITISEDNKHYKVDFFDSFTHELICSSFGECIYLDYNSSFENILLKDVVFEYQDGRLYNGKSAFRDSIKLTKVTETDENGTNKENIYISFFNNTDESTLANSFETENLKESSDFNE